MKFLSMRSTKPLGMKTPPTDLGPVTADNDETDPAKLASFLHQAGKLCRLYVDPELFANPAWDIMLTLYLGEHDGVTVSRASLAAGNRLSDDECDAFLDRLETRRFVTRSKHVEGQPQQIRLSKNGRQRMQAFLRSAARE